jgi:hypothetical protein
MRAYLGEGELMSDHEALARLALEAGLPEDEVRDTLATARFQVLLASSWASSRPPSPTCSSPAACVASAPRRPRR